MDADLGQLRAKLAKLNRELLAPSGGGGGGEGFDVARTGIATVAFMGFPSVRLDPKSLAICGLTPREPGWEINFDESPDRCGIARSRIRIHNLNHSGLSYLRRRHTSAANRLHSPGQWK